FKKHQFALKTNLSSRWLISSFAMMGLAVLCKGPVGIVLPIIVILSFLTYEGHLKDFGEKSLKHLLIGALVFLAITLPWYVSVHLATSGEFTKEFFLGHNLSRFTSVHTGHHAPFWFYLPVIMIGFFPWIFFLIPAIWSSSTIKNFSANSEPSLDARTIRFCIIWAITIFVFYSLSQTKLPTYILPIFLPLSIIVAKWWQDKFKTNKSQNNKNQDLLRATQCLLFIIIIFDILFFKFFSGLILNLDSKAFFLPIALISFLYIAASVIGTAGALFKARITFICIITASIISQIIFVTMMLVPFAKARDAGSKAFTKRLSSNSVLYTYRIHPTRFSFYKRDKVIKLKDKSINHTLQQNSQQERYLVASKNDYQKLSKNSQLNLIEKNQVFAFYRVIPSS
ncbi:MAG: hypothetical protein LW817_04240, partial [Candidatus Caenarcaniphilales bacterium]|nr:hypothetical protein [Candidatus Caenarcaniphilales bacterium]